MDFIVRADHSEKTKKSEKTDKYFDIAWKLNNKKMKPEGHGGINWSWCPWNGPQRFGKKTGRIRNQKNNQDHPDTNIVKIG